ncbi:hypothetical protein [Hoeflea olei]|uniref:Uncharacterized protein n=1 Tax=Hoeflea olei TaxID=1480615 RepID=A0A1C1YT26_9HYPH|nr:hypothetical protein [Hoeflea olei]OCW56683.1 hypothetical protein AWJ14_17285 [Hoeflea olei]
MDGFLSVVSVVLRVLVLLAVAALVFSMTADALELSRNGKTYSFDLALPKGVAFKARGVDRVLRYRGIDISLRLIQDEYADCGQLVSERERRMFDRGQYVSDAGTIISQKECEVSLFGPKGASLSSYIYLEICQCYVAIHLTYPNDVAFDAVVPVISGFGDAFSNRRKIPETATVAETVEPDWKEAFDIFRQRNLTAQLAYNIYSQSTSFALASERETKAAVTYLASLFGISDYDVQNGFSGGIDWVYDVETGKALYEMSPQAIARSISSCYKRGNPGANCSLNYHQEMGCRMTKKWAELCSTPDRPGISGIYDLCWGEPRGDMPMLPVVADNAERSVQLPTNGKGGKGAKAKGEAVTKNTEKVAVAYCDDDIWRQYYARTPSDSIPAGFEP